LQSGIAEINGPYLNMTSRMNGFYCQKPVPKATVAAPLYLHSSSTIVRTPLKKIACCLPAGNRYKIYPRFFIHEAGLIIIACSNKGFVRFK
jgi:hypothetical protein